MLRRSAIFLAALLTLLSSGCSHQIPSYAPDPQPTNLLRGGSARLKLVLQPAAFSDDGSLMCRLSDPVSLPNGQSFRLYIMDALHQELKASELTDQATGREFTLHPKRVDFSSALGATNWFLDVEYSSMGEKFVVSTVYNDRSSYEGTKTCGNIALYEKLHLNAPPGRAGFFTSGKPLPSTCASCTRIRLSGGRQAYLLRRVKPRLVTQRRCRPAPATGCIA